MLRALLFAALALMLVSCTHYSGKTPPKIVEGVLDARDWDLSKDGPIDLRGDWEVLPEGVLFDEEVIAPQRSCCAPDIVGRLSSPYRKYGCGNRPSSRALATEGGSALVGQERAASKKLQHRCRI